MIFINKLTSDVQRLLDDNWSICEELTGSFGVTTDPGPGQELIEKQSDELVTVQIILFGVDTGGRENPSRESRGQSCD